MDDTRQEDAHKQNENYTELRIVKTVQLINNYLIHKTVFKSKFRQRRVLHNRPATNGFLFITRQRLSLPCSNHLFW